MRRLLFTGATVVMGLAGSLGIATASATHAAAAVSRPAHSCGWRDHGRCGDWRWCDWDCDRHGHHHRDRCDWGWDDCRRWWW